jgi:hypothetical protein
MRWVLAALRCEDGITIMVVVCEAGNGMAGKSLQKHLLAIFGPKTKVVTYEGACGFAPWWRGGGTTAIPWGTRKAKRE